jgi:hypothetical protein
LIQTGKQLTCPPKTSPAIKFGIKTAYHTSAEPELANSSDKPCLKVLRLQSEGASFFFDQIGKIITIELKAPFL